SAVAFAQPLAEPKAHIPDSHEARLAKADRLQGAAVSSGLPQRAVLADEGIASPEDVSTGSSKPPGPIARHRHKSKSKKVTTAAHPRSEPKATVMKRTAISQRPNAASDAEPCRLKAFGGLREALNSADCEI